jgi:hypothetical protein
MYELNHAFPETYPEGFTELNLNLDLVRKYPAQKLDRKLWRKINKRSSIQFTGSIVDDAHCQEDNDMSYKVSLGRVHYFYFSLLLFLYIMLWTGHGQGIEP